MLICVLPQQRKFGLGPDVLKVLRFHHGAPVLFSGTQPEPFEGPRTPTGLIKSDSKCRSQACLADLRAETLLVTRSHFLPLYGLQ